MPAAPRPGRGTTRRLMSRGRLSRAKAAREESPLLGRWHRTWRYGADRERIGDPLAGPRPRSTDSGKPTSEAFGAGAGAGRGRHSKPAGQAPPHALEALAGSGREPEDPSRRGRLKPPKALQTPLPRLGRARERPPPAKFPQGNPASPNRSAAPAQGENGAPSPKNTEARRPTEPFEPTAERGQGHIPPPPPSHDPSSWNRHSPVRRLPPEPPPPNPGPEGPCPGSGPRRPTIRRFRVTSKRRAIQENGQARNS